MRSAGCIVGCLVATRRAILSRTYLCISTASSQLNRLSTVMEYEHECVLRIETSSVTFSRGMMMDLLRCSWKASGRFAAAVTRLIRLPLPILYKVEACFSPNIFGAVCGGLDGWEGQAVTSIFGLRAKEPQR